FWSTAWIETTEEGTKILATVDGKLRTVFESSNRRNLKLNDEAGIIDEHASPIGDDSQGEACPTDSGLEADQDRANIPKTSTLPSNSTQRVTFLAADEGSMQQKLNELTALCTSLQRQQSEMVSKFEAQELEINSLKARIKLLEDKDGGVAEQYGDDAPIKGRRLDEGEEAVKRVSDDTEEMTTVLTSMDAAKEEGTRADRCSAGKSVRGKDAQRMNEQIAQDVKIARIQAEEELQMLIDGLDRNNETVAKKQQKEFYMSVLKSYAGWKAKHFKGMTLEEIKEKFDPVWKQFQDFNPIGSKEKAERFKRKGLRLEQESVKKLKTSEEFSHQEKCLIHTIIQCLSPESTGFNEFSSNIATALVCLATNRVYNFSKMIFDGQFGQITHTHTYAVPFHTRKIFTTLRVNSPSFSGRTVPLFPSMLVTMGEGSGTPTESHRTPSPEAQQTSPTATSSQSLPPVTTVTIPTQMSMHILLGMTVKDLEIATLKARIKHLEDRDGGDDDPSGEDATIKGRRLETGEEAGIKRSTEKGSDDIEEMVNVL
nr:hypothetical protein [Tanacetum cinerariifolium]GFA38720.1 hypothetical protein [Tanacetum cinerariifolium]